MVSSFATICRCLRDPKLGFRCLLALFVVFGSFEKGAGCCCTRALAAAAERTSSDSGDDPDCPASAARKPSCCQSSDRTPKPSSCCTATPARTAGTQFARCCVCCSHDAPQIPRVPEPKSSDNDRSKSSGAGAVTLPDAPACDGLPASLKPVLTVFHQHELLSHNQTQSLLCVWRN